jgi:alkylated DNA nucleotide flippase Atl1
MNQDPKPNYKQKVIDLVNTIPAGKVTNFGTIGKQIGISGQMVGWILSGMREDEWSICPWYRVVAKDGYISSLKLGTKGLLQKQILQTEGYQFIEDCVDMGKHFWGFENGANELYF